MPRKKITNVVFYQEVLIYVFERENNNKKTNSWDLTNKFKKECRESSSLLRKKLENMINLEFLSQNPIPPAFEYEINYEGILKYIIEELLVGGIAKKKAYSSLELQKLLKLYLKCQEIEKKAKIRRSDVTLNQLFNDFIVTIGLSSLENKLNNKNVNFNDDVVKSFVQMAKDYIYQLSFKVSNG